MDTKNYNYFVLHAFSILLCLFVLSCNSKGNSSEKTEEIDEGLRVVDGRLVNGQGEEIYGKHDNYTFDYKGDYILVSDYKYNSDYDRTDTLNGILSATGEEILPCKYIFHTPYENGYFILSEPNGKDGMMTPDLKLVVPCKYSEMYISSYDYPECITIREGKRIGKLNMEGEVLVPCEYDNVVIRKNEKIKGFQLKPGYAFIHTEARGCALYSIEEQREIIFGRGKFETVGENHISVKRSDHVGLCDYDGKVIVPCSYLSIIGFHGELYGEICHEGRYLANGNYEFQYEFDIYSMSGEYLRTQWLSESENCKIRDVGSYYASLNW